MHVSGPSRGRPSVLDELSLPSRSYHGSVAPSTNGERPHLQVEHRSLCDPQPAHGEDSAGVRASGRPWSMLVSADVQFRRLCGILRGHPGTSGERHVSAERLHAARRIQVTRWRRRDPGREARPDLHDPGPSRGEWSRAPKEHRPGRRPEKAHLRDHARRREGTPEVVRLGSRGIAPAGRCTRTCTIAPQSSKAAGLPIVEALWYEQE